MLTCKHDARVVHSESALNSNVRTKVTKKALIGKLPLPVVCGKMNTKKAGRGIPKAVSYPYENGRKT